MDFSDSPDEAAFRARAKAWLEANAPRSIPTAASEEDLKATAQAWQALKSDASFACITWPVEWGGAGGTAMEQIIFNEEEAKYGLVFPFFAIGLGMCVPTILAAGSVEQKKRFVTPALRGEEIWCQLFSEPGAGSDVAASRTRAVPADDDSGDWLITGQKVWTSGAHYSDFGLLLVRTDPDVPKHKGLTMFWVGMKEPGVEVRPIHQASGDSDFNEVYFNGVRVKDSQRIGELNDGWNIALITLMNERLSVGGGGGPDWRDLIELARELPGVGHDGSVLTDGGFREKIVDWYVAAEGLRYTRLRTMTALSRGQTPGPEASIGKVVAARQMQNIAYEALDCLDQSGIIVDRSADSIVASFQRNFFWGAAMRIAGGSDEILKNIIAERVLGLPLDIRVDRDVAFKDIPHAV